MLFTKLCPFLFLSQIFYLIYEAWFAAFGVDAAFSYKFNQQLGICDEDGLVVCSGLTTSHAFPVGF